MEGVTEKQNKKVKRGGSGTREQRELKDVGIQKQTNILPCVNILHLEAF